MLFSKLAVHSYHLRTLLKMQVVFISPGLVLRLCISNKSKVMLKLLVRSSHCVTAFSNMLTKSLVLQIDKEAIYTM